MGNDTVAVVGTGIMGSAMARNLLRAGRPTVVWDRSAKNTAPLAEAGATVAGSVPDAVADARVVLTMLPTADVVRSTMLDDAVTAAFARDAVWAQMGTIGLEPTRDLAGALRKRRPDVSFVDAPVSGSKGPAEAGDLLVLASGPASAETVVTPAFDAIGRRTLWLGPAGQGTAMKLAINAYMAILIEGVAESLQLAADLGIAPADLARAVEGGPLDAPIAGDKLHKMATGDYAPEFPLQWALKDVDLALGAAGSDRLPLLAALSRQWRAAVDGGHGTQDVSAARLAVGRPERR